MRLKYRYSKGRYHVWLPRVGRFSLDSLPDIRSANLMYWCYNRNGLERTVPY